MNNREALPRLVSSLSAFWMVSGPDVGEPGVWMVGSLGQGV